MIRTVLAFLLACSATTAAAGSGGGSSISLENVLMKMFPHPMFLVGYGLTDWTIKSPQSGIKLDKMWTIEGNFAFDVTIFRLMLGYNYSGMLGTADYDYTDPISSVQTTSGDADMNNNMGTFNLGLRLPLGGSFPLHPFIGGGGQFGFAEFRFPDLAKANPGSANKYSEKANFTGGYYEAGIEWIIAKRVAIAGTYRHSKLDTAKFSTLGDKGLTMEGSTAMVSVGARW